MDYKVDIETEDSMPSWDSLWGRFFVHPKADDLASLGARSMVCRSHSPCLLAATRITGLVRVGPQIRKGNRIKEE